MTTRKMFAILIGCALSAFALSPAEADSGGYDLTQFNEHDPTAQDFIEALKPEADEKVDFRGLVIVEETKPKAISLDMITFEFDSYELAPRAKQALGELAKALNSQDLIEFNYLVEGHTDSLGSSKHNQILSEKRAEAVRDYLSTMYNIDARRLWTEGRGEFDPLPGIDAQDEMNRRVQIVHLE